MIPEEFVNTGYESHNSVLILGSNFLLIFAYTSVSIFTIIIGKLSYKNKRSNLRKVYKMLKPKLFYGFLIQLIISSFMEIVMSSYLNLRAKLYSFNGEIIGVVVSYINLAVVFMIFPMVYGWVLFRPLHRLNSPKFRKKWEAFYQESRLSSYWNLIYNLVSMLRRFSFLVFAVFVPYPTI